MGYTMPFIPDKQVYAAVRFALMLRRKMGTGLAVYKAARYYRVSESEVASYLGKTGANKLAKNRQAALKENGG